MSIVGPREDSGARSAITATPELKAAVEACSTPGEIAQVMRDFAARQGVAVQNVDGELVPTGVTRPARHGGYVTVDGVKTYVEGSSPEELQEKMREAMAPRAATEQPRDPATGRFTEQRQTQQMPPDPNQQALDAAVTDYLVRQGINPEDLRTISEQKLQQSWTDATAAFLKDPNNDWPGGDQNRDTLAKIIAANPELLDADDKVAALTAAYNYAKESGLLVENPETLLAQRLASAKSSAEIDELLGRHQRNNYDRGY